MRLLKLTDSVLCFSQNLHAISLKKTGAPLQSGTPSPLSAVETPWEEALLYPTLNNMQVDFNKIFLRNGGKNSLIRWQVQIVTQDAKVN